MNLSKEEMLKLREILRISLGKRANELSEEELSEFGITLLEATAIALKARCLLKK
jgi:hypothetical protein